MYNKITPIVSVVMAAFNEEKYIYDSIDSVLNQSFTEFEFIIVNDGSTDNTEKIILSFNDTRIKYIKNEKNLKLIDSLNKGLEASKGKYIARMDADDICLPNRLKIQVDFMEQNPEIGISGSQLTVFGDSEGVMNYPLEHEDIRLGLFITSCFGNNVVILRRDVLEKHKLFFPKGYFHAEDYKCWTNWLSVTRAKNLDISLVKYRSHSNSVSVQNKVIQRQTRNRIRTEYLTGVFDLKNDSKIALDFTGKNSKKRINAINTILHINKTSNCFDDIKFKNIVLDLWYLDSLEEAESGFFIIFKYPLIFRIEFKNNFKKWIFLLKHYLKFKFNN